MELQKVVLDRSQIVIRLLLNHRQCPAELISRSRPRRRLAWHESSAGFAVHYIVFKFHRLPCWLIMQGNLPWPVLWRDSRVLLLRVLIGFINNILHIRHVVQHFFHFKDDVWKVGQVNRFFFFLRLLTGLVGSHRTLFFFWLRYWLDRVFWVNVVGWRQVLDIRIFVATLIVGYSTHEVVMLDALFFVAAGTG